MAAVGVIGLGVMGRPIARRLAERGHTVTGYGVTAQAPRGALAP
jgi:3-hydroxyisobutyrate dehydrogenase-like beta-hydroxyacid dehydrogenase